MRIVTSTLALAAVLCFPSVAGAEALAGQPLADEKAEEGTDADEMEGEEVIVTATRDARPRSAIPALVTVIDREDVEQQRLIATDTSSLLAQLVPGFAPSRQKLTSFGESFRGREPLYLIDGVPQSNPLRNGSREAYTIDLAVVERIEVVNGANAIQGLGATGGIVNFVTRRPDPSGRLVIGADAAVTFTDDLNSEGFENRASLYATKDFGALDVIAAASYARRELFFDAEGRPIGVDATQGDLADSDQLNLFAKIGWEPTPDQRLQLTANRFELSGDGDYLTVPGVRTTDTPAQARKGSPGGEAPTNEVLTLSLDYRHEALLGGVFDAQLYRQKFGAIYGGGVFSDFQDPLIAPVGSLFDQSQNRSEKYGARATIRHERVAGTPATSIVGIDLLRDTTEQALINSDRLWVPETTYENLAPFLQVDLPLGPVRLAGGARYELARLTVPDFETIAGNRSDYVRTPVEGGSPDFGDVLVNGAVILEPLDGVSAYASYSQGYTIPDVGRVLRGIATPGQSVEDILDLQPVVADNYEVGLTVTLPGITAQLAGFISQADRGSRLVADADGIFSVLRQKTRVRGIEASVEGRLPFGLTAGGNLSIQESRADTDADGRIDADLDAINAAPDRLNLYVGWERGDLSARLQSATLFDRDFRNRADAVTATFEGYTTADLYLGHRTGFGRVSLAVQNLLDEQFITYFGQAAPPLRGDRYFAGRGRTISLGLQASF